MFGNLLYFLLSDQFAACRYVPPAPEDVSAFTSLLSVHVFHSLYNIRRVLASPTPKGSPLLGGRQC